jgi:hypothetical protein
MHHQELWNICQKMVSDVNKKFQQILPSFVVIWPKEKSPIPIVQSNTTDVYVSRIKIDLLARTTNFCGSAIFKKDRFSISSSKLFCYEAK